MRNAKVSQYGFRQRATTHGPLLGLFVFVSAFLFLPLNWAQDRSTPARSKVNQKGNQPQNPKSPDLGQLRERFAAAVGKDFDVIKDEFKGRRSAEGGGIYWLVHVRPNQPGYYRLNHRDNYSDAHYAPVERECTLNLGASGCRRGPPQTGSYSRFCVGDRIIIPIVINNFSEHAFKLTRKEYSPKDDAVFDEEKPYSRDTDVNSATVTNPAADMMRYVGSSSHKLLIRSGGYTLEHFATFEAVKPGRLNLGVGTSPRTRSDDGVAIIIVPRDAPVTLLASHQEVRGYSRGYDGREWVSSTSGDAFMSDLMILQPGDRISLSYAGSRRSPEFERRERAGNEKIESIPPVISKLPFKLKTEYNFSSWLVDYLPAQ